MALLLIGTLVYQQKWPDTNGAAAILTLLAVLGGGILSILASWWYYWKQQRENSYLKRVYGGLTGFEDKICDLTKGASTSVQLSLVTPLLHSFRYKWIPYTAEHFHDHGRDKNYWPNKFCKEFLDLLTDRMKDGGKLEIEIMFLEDKALERVVHGLGLSIPWGQYKESVAFFVQKLKSVLKNSSTAGDKEASPDIRIAKVPFYLCLVDCKSAESGALPPNAHGLVAFISSETLLEQKTKQGRSADEIALQVMTYEFHHPEVVQFFVSQFDHLKNGTSAAGSSTSAPASAAQDGAGGIAAPTGAGQKLAPA